MSMGEVASVDDENELIPAFVFGVAPNAEQDEIETRYNQLLAELPESLHADVREAYAQLETPDSRVLSHLFAIPRSRGLQSIARWSATTASPTRMTVEELAALVAETLDD